jgi:hypothetical protein
MPADVFSDRLEMLRRARHGPFRELPWSEEIDLTATAPETHEMTWTAGDCRSTGGDPYVTFTLPAPVRVHAVRIQITAADADPSPARMQVFWALRGTNDFGEHERTARRILRKRTADQTLTIPIDDTIDRLRFDPNEGRFEGRVSVVLLVE